ncbi:MAG: ankyrin repeat domain-containing protein [bacterium]|nr:ankyrin repeat domain-containing protein [bacterium]
MAEAKRRRAQDERERLDLAERLAKIEREVQVERQRSQEERMALAADLQRQRRLSEEQAARIRELEAAAEAVAPGRPSASSQDPAGSAFSQPRGLEDFRCEMGFASIDGVEAGWTLAHHAAQFSGPPWQRREMLSVMEELAPRLSPELLARRTGQGKPTGWTVLQMLANNRDAAGVRPAMIRSVLAARGNIEERSLRGKTPLLVAASTGHEAAVEALLHHGADRHAVDDEGCGALDVCDKSHREIRELLFRWGVRRRVESTGKGRCTDGLRAGRPQWAAGRRTGRVCGVRGRGWAAWRSGAVGERRAVGREAREWVCVRVAAGLASACAHALHVAQVPRAPPAGGRGGVGGAPGAGPVVPGAARRQEGRQERRWRGQGREEAQGEVREAEISASSQQKEGGSAFSQPPPRPGAAGLPEIARGSAASDTMRLAGGAVAECVARCTVAQCGRVLPRMAPCVGAGAVCASIVWRVGAGRASVVARRSSRL